MPKPKFSIIVVSWNALPLLQTYLPSVVAALPEDSELILADNGSTDESIEWTTTHFPQVKVASLDKNYYYCGGNNRGAQLAQHEWLIFLNNDVRVAPDWLEQLSRAIERHPEAAAFQPKMLSDREPEYFEYAGAAGGELDFLGYPFCRGRLFDTCEKDDGQYEEDTPIFWASGAALCVKKSVFEQLGGFEECFEFHMEEIDLCWRIWRAGHQVRYVAQSKVWHLGGGSLNAQSPRKTFYNFRNNWWMLQRNLPPHKLIGILITRLTLDAAAVCFELIRGRFAHAQAIIEAVHHAITHPQKPLTDDFLQHEAPIHPNSVVIKHFLG